MWRRRWLFKRSRADRSYGLSSPTRRLPVGVMFIYGEPTAWAHQTENWWSRSAVRILLAVRNNEGILTIFSSGRPKEYTRVMASDGCQHVRLYKGIIENQSSVSLDEFPWQNDKWKVAGTKQSFQIFVCESASARLFTVKGQVEGCEV